jgi:hypothetical protein
MSKQTTRTNIDIDSVNLQRFKELYPAHGSIKWFVNACFAYFNTMHDTNPHVLIEEAVAEAVNDLTREADDESKKVAD